MAEHVGQDDVQQACFHAMERVPAGGRARARGTIAHLSGGGYGFIECGAGRVLFFYRSDVENTPFDALRRGDRVEFDTKGDELWPSDRALRVRRIGARPRP